MDTRRLEARLQEMAVEYQSRLEEVRLGKDKNHAQLHGLRKDVARIKTVLREKLEEKA